MSVIVRNMSSKVHKFLSVNDWPWKLEQYDDVGISGYWICHLNGIIDSQYWCLFKHIFKYIRLLFLDNPLLYCSSDILAGSVSLFNNYNLCHVKTIDWDEIITGPNASYLYVYNFSLPERECPPCDKSCPKGCWGAVSYTIFHVQVG